MPGEQAATPVDVITHHHHYSGLVRTEGVRLADILSDCRLEVLEMHETVLRTEGVRSAELRCGQILLKKKELLLAIPKGSYEAPVRRHNNYQKKERYGAVITMPGLLLSGVVHLPPRATPWMLLDDQAGLPRFFGVTNVTVHGSIHRFTPSQCDTVILHRELIEGVQLTERPLPEQRGPSIAAEGAEQGSEVLIP
jgi:hypothetical protein